MFRFVKFIEGARSRPATLADFTLPSLQAFLHAEIAAGYHRHTLTRRVASLKAFNQFQNKPIDWDQLSRLLPGSNPENSPLAAPISLQSSHIDALLETMEQYPQARARRDQALLALMLETGLPVERVLGLNLGDLQTDCKILSLTQASGKKESISLEWAGRALHRYLKEGRPELSRQPDNPALWISQAGSRMTRQAVWQALRGWGRRAGLPFPLSPRLLGHTATLRLLHSNLPLRQIQLRLGHQSSLSTLARLRRISASI